MKKDLSVSALIGAYDRKFYPLVGNYGNGISPSDLADQNREVIYPAKCPLNYDMGAANDDVIGLAYVTASFAEGPASAMINGAGNQTAVSSSLGGIVRRMQSVSRNLENSKGTDLLEQRGTVDKSTERKIKC